MKVIAYSVPPRGKGLLAQANQKKHEITLIANPLSSETAFYAQGKQAVIVFSNTPVFAPVLDLLAHLGIRYVLFHSEIRCPTYKNQIAHPSLVCAHVSLLPLAPAGVMPLEYWQQAAEQTIGQLDKWQLQE